MLPALLDVSGAERTELPSGPCKCTDCLAMVPSGLVTTRCNPRTDYFLSTAYYQTTQPSPRPHPFQDITGRSVQATATQSILCK